MSLATELAARLPHGRVTHRAEVCRLVFEHDGCWLDARVHDTQRVQVYVRTARVDGFTLSVRPDGSDVKLGVAARWRDGVMAYDDDELAAAVAALAPSWGTLTVETSDDAMAALWLDDAARSALAEAQWWRLLPDGLTPRGGVAGFHHELARGEVAVLRASRESEAHVVAAVRAGAALAARPHRLAGELAAVAAALGGSATTDRWDLGERYALRFERGAADVQVDWLRTLPGEDDDAPLLRTRVRARRIAPDGARWAVWRADLADAHRPRLGRGARDAAPPPGLGDGLRAAATDPAGLPGRLGPAAAMLRSATPDAAWAAGEEVAATWAGVLTDPGRLGAGVEAVARLALDRAGPTGPYR